MKPTQYVPLAILGFIAVVACVVSIGAYMTLPEKTNSTATQTKGTN